MFGFLMGGNEMKERSEGVVVVTAAVALREGRVLLARRREGDHMGGRWEFPGGKVHAGESPAAALARELAEELGVEAAVEAPLTFVHWEYPEKRILLLFFRCRIVSGEPRPLECAAVDWFRPAELAGLDLAPADAAAWGEIDKRLKIED
jgi:8-oxo-dGTP diphosphatase